MNQALIPITQTLLNLELVPEADLLEISQRHRDSKSVIQALLEKQLVSSRALSTEFSKRFGTPLLDIAALDMDNLPKDLIEIALVERHLVVPCYRRGNLLYVAMVDPTNKAALDEVKFYTGLQIIPIQVEMNALQEVINTLVEEENGSLQDVLTDQDLELEVAGDTELDQTSELDFDPNDAPIVKYVNKMLLDAINQGASDIHIEPFARELRIRFRIDGILHIITKQPISFARRITARIKIIARLDIAERRIPQDGRVKLRISKSKAYEFRVNTLPTVHGEKVVLRILDSNTASLELSRLGFTRAQLSTYKKAVQRPYGMVLITGPTGSGKTLTLYSALNMLNTSSKNISSVEDPVEIQLAGITQVNINEKAKLGFANTLRAFLRQDPDIIMLGEIRDLETAEIAVKASQTGHLVLSTLHTNDATSTLTRLLNMGIPAFNLASAVHLIVAQRLVRKLCRKCKKTIKLPKKILIAAGFKESIISTLDLFQADSDGCTNCINGYRGRVGIFQVMQISKPIQKLILNGASENDIKQCAAKAGALDLRTSGLEKCREGLTSLAEVERVTNI